MRQPIDAEAFESAVFELTRQFNRLAHERCEADDPYGTAFAVQQERAVQRIWRTTATRFSINTTRS